MFKTYYVLPLMAAFTFGCGDKDAEDTGSEDTAAPADSGDDTGESGDDTGESGDDTGA